MNNALQTLKLSDEERIKKHLRQSLTRKRAALRTIAQKVEMLKVELELVKDEYNVRIGKLFLKDNSLDLEIIRYRNIASLMETGLSFDEAVKQIEDTIYNQLLELHKQEEEIEIAEELMNEREKATQEAPETFENDIKKLWKRLIVKFHPDLVTNPIEKSKREEIMKKINNAYKENDFELLQILESKLYTEDVEETTIPRLEQTLVEIENMILSLQNQYKDLRTSEWFGWKLKLDKAKIKKVDVFADLERTLLDDIVRKIQTLKSLKKQVGDPLVY